MAYEGNPELYEPVELKPHQKILLDAANLIRTYGHCKGDAGSSVVGFCVLGAIHEVCVPDDEKRTYDFGARARFSETIGTPCIAFWNDIPERTKEEVIHALEEAAKL